MLPCPSSRTPRGNPGTEKAPAAAKIWFHVAQMLYCRKGAFEETMIDDAGG
jgi:hypothetical protein